MTMSDDRLQRSETSRIAVGGWLLAGSHMLEVKLSLRKLVVSREVGAVAQLQLSYVSLMSQANGASGCRQLRSNTFFL